MYNMSVLQNRSMHSAHLGPLQDGVETAMHGRYFAAMTTISFSAGWVKVQSQCLPQSNLVLLGQLGRLQWLRLNERMGIV
jgi:hypothetical protein